MGNDREGRAGCAAACGLLDMYAHGLTAHTTHAQGRTSIAACVRARTEVRGRRRPSSLLASASVFTHVPVYICTVPRVS